MSTFAERFWAKVDRSGECWLWTAARTNSGYGRIQLGGKARLAHRVVWAMTNGPIPDGLDIDHLCHNADQECRRGRGCLHRRCVRPSHIEPTTTRENLVRGHTFIALNVGKTHCPKGHPLSGANLYARTARTNRQCRTCRRDQDRASRLRRAA